MFDLDKLYQAVKNAVAAFAADHDDETFNAFAIDADMLCLNSEQVVTSTLAEYQTRWPDCYSDPAEIEDLKYNTGDWIYQGFFDRDDTHGFDRDAYNLHYAEAGSSADGTAPHSRYAKAMNTLIARLKRSDVFACMEKSQDFRIVWVEHTY